MRKRNQIWGGGSRRIYSDVRVAAFTLIEVMIAVTIFAGVILAIYTSWTAILRGADLGARAATEAQRARISLRCMQESLASAQLFMGNIGLYAFLTDTSNPDFAQLSFVAELPSSFPGSGLFPGQPVRRLTFSVEPGQKSQNQLLLRQSALLEPAESMVQPYTIILAPHVNEFSLAFWDTNQMEWLEEWLPTNQLPKVVRVALSLGEPGKPVKPEDRLMQSILLSSVPITRELQASRGGGPRIDPVTGQPLPPNVGPSPDDPGTGRTGTPRGDGVRGGARNFPGNRR